MDSIGANLQAVRARIARAAAAAGRDVRDVALIAVSKTFSADAIRAAYAAGQRAFGENYVQEALPKIAALADLSLEWHFIGPIQSNKTRAIAEHFDWAHGIDRLKIAERLSAARPAGRAPLQVCIEVNLGGETSKGGVAPAEAPALARALRDLPGIRLRGLMAIPPASNDTAQQHRDFARLRRLRDEMAAAGAGLDTLSMGMSNDFEAAIAEGATLVRIGTAIFGERRTTEPSRRTDAEKI
ncbi:MAG TPA: YggS family pyridoxal phosphate-dependent enzyme [Burkholderiales bacterium]|nr:YggS family pyridoxal phosphate-dependent enzyme [Burkholderiales bacterium]